MRILDRYLLREFTAYSLLGLGSFISITIIVDLTEKLSRFVDYSTPVSTVLRYYAYGMPAVLTQMIPVAVLLGSLLSLGQLRKHNEITAMQSSGESPWRLARPLLILALLVSIAQYALNESVGPGAHVEQSRIMTEEVRRQAADRSSRTAVRLLGGGSRFYVAQYYDARTLTLRDVSVQFLDRAEIRERVDANRAEYVDGIWRFRDGFYRTFIDTGEVAVPFRVYGSGAMSEQPGDFARTQMDPFNMGMRPLLLYARRLKESGGQTQRHMTNFHIRASFPLASLIMVLLGTGLSLRVARGGNVALGFGISITVGFAYFAFLRLGQALGYNGTIPPMPAAWLGNMVFGGIGFFLFRKITR